MVGEMTMKVLYQAGMLFIQQMYFIFVIFGSAFILLGSLYLLRTTRRFNQNDGVPPGK